MVEILNFEDTRRIPKIELIRRVRDLVIRLRSMKQPGVDDCYEVAVLEHELDAMERELAYIIDNFMAAQIEKRLLRSPHYDINGLSGRWNQYHR
jgi:hypothetical protein